MSTKESFQKDTFFMRLLAVLQKASVLWEVLEFPVIRGRFININPCDQFT